MQQVLYYGGPILTLEQPLYAEALLQQGGIIRAVGPLEKLKAMATPHLEDAQGRIESG